MSPESFVPCRTMQAARSAAPGFSGRAWTGLRPAIAILALVVTAAAASVAMAAGSTGSAALAAPPGGQGAGHHSAQSPIKPLPQRSDVLPWSRLTNLKKKTLPDRIEPVFNASQKALNQTVQRVQGFMVPMDTRPGQKHFLLTSVPLTCSFCTPGGPESMIEVMAKTPVRHSLEPVVVEGRFQTLSNDPYGLFYRLVDARQVK